MMAMYVLHSGNAVMCFFQHDDAAKVTVLMRYARPPSAADRVEAEELLAQVMEEVGFEEAPATPVYGHPN